MQNKHEELRGKQGSSQEAPAVTQPRNVGGLGQGGTHGEQRLIPNLVQKQSDRTIWGTGHGV